MKCIFERPLVLVLLLTWITLWSGVAIAEGGTGQLGLLYGMSVPDADNTNPHGISGFKGFAYVSPSLSLGGYYLMAGGSQGSGGRNFKYSFHGLEGAYRIPAGTGEAFVGLRLGLSKLRTEPTSGNNLIFSPYHYGLAGGYDYLALSMLTVGFEGFYLGVDRSTTTTSGVTYQEKSFHVFGLMATLQLRF